MLKNKNLNLLVIFPLILLCVLFITVGTASADLCADAVGPLAVPSVTAGTTIGATIDSEAPLCGTQITSPGVWYSVIGTGGMMTVFTCGVTTYDSKLSIFSGSCVSLVCVGGNDDACGLQSSVSFTSVAGTEYLILVHGFGGQTGNFTLTIEAGPIPILSTQAATSVATTSATLNGSVNTNGSDTTVTFEYGLDTNYGTTVTAAQSPLTDPIDASVSAPITSLTPGTTYHFRVVAQNTVGTTYGADVTFTTEAAPVAIPTLSEWGMIIMSLMMAGSAFWMIRRRTS